MHRLVHVLYRGMSMVNAPVFCNLSKKRNRGGLRRSFLLHITFPDPEGERVRAATRAASSHHAV